MIVILFQIIFFYQQLGQKILPIVTENVCVYRSKYQNINTIGMSIYRPRSIYSIFLGLVRIIPNILGFGVVAASLSVCSTNLHLF